MEGNAIAGMCDAPQGPYVEGMFPRVVLLGGGGSHQGSWEYRKFPHRELWSCILPSILAFCFMAIKGWFISVIQFIYSRPLVQSNGTNKS